jgi:hypothetical protein
MPTIKRIGECRATKSGHAIEIDLEFSDGTFQTIECPMEHAPMLSLGVQASAGAAEKMQRAQPLQEISLEIPLVATDIRTGTNEGGVAMKVLTTMGTPVVVAMTAEIAQATIERLSAELRKLVKPQPFRH